MRTIFQNINLGISFFLELAVLSIYGVFGYWLVPESSPVVLKVLAGILAAAAFAILWGMIFAPKASHRLRMPWLLLGKTLMLGGGVLMLFSLDREGLAIGILIVIVINFGLALMWKQL